MDLGCAGGRLNTLTNSGSHHSASQTNGATSPVTSKFPHSHANIRSAITVKLTEICCLLMRLTTSFQSQFRQKQLDPSHRACLFTLGFHQTLLISSALQSFWCGLVMVMIVNELFLQLDMETLVLSVLLHNYFPAIALSQTEPTDLHLECYIVKKKLNLTNEINRWMVLRFQWF